ncbi:MAG: hypothetical protein ABIF04_03665 [Chloroflexota bacterium]
MSFLKQLFSPFPSNYGRFYNFSVKCKRCSETIEGQVNLGNDPSLEFDEQGKPYYVCRKVLVGNKLCFQKIEVIFKFNEQHGVLEKQITGGEFVEG